MFEVSSAFHTGSAWKASTFFVCSLNKQVDCRLALGSMWHFSITTTRLKKADLFLPIHPYLA